MLQNIRCDNDIKATRPKHFRPINLFNIGNT